MMPRPNRYISSWKMTLECEWADHDDKDFYDETVEVNPNGIPDKYMDYVLEAIERQRNDDEETFDDEEESENRDE